MSPLKIIFAGTPEFGVPCLNALLHSSHTLQAIYTQPDRPAGRGRKLQTSAVKEWALRHDIAVYQPVNFKTQEARDELAALEPDLIVVIAYGLILPQAVLDIPRLGCINVHASLLPRWRGASPIQQAVFHGDAETGVTIMQMDAGMDTGAMLAKVTCSICNNDTAGSMHDKLAHISAEPLVRIIDSLALGLAQPVVQDDSLATYAKKINKEDGLINWHQQARAIDRQIRAFTPWPIAYSILGAEQIRIHHAIVVPLSTSAPPGTIVQLDKKGMLVAAADDGLLIDKIQFSGGKVISIVDWLNSGKTQLQAGVILQ